MARARARFDEAPTGGAHGGGDGPVQLSVRLAPRLRREVAEIARARGQSVTGFVIEALEDAVRTAGDPFAGLAADMVADLRAELARALESGTYAPGPGTAPS